MYLMYPLTSSSCMYFLPHPSGTPPCSNVGTVRLLHRRYRKVISNVCEGGVNKQQSAKQHTCPLLPPRGLQLGIKGQMLAVAPGDDITFIVHQEQVRVCVCVNSLSLSTSTSLYLYLSLSLSTALSLYLSLSTSLSISLYLSLSTSLSTSLYPSLCVCVCVSLSLSLPPPPLQVLIPISLFVSIELVKISQVFFIHQDAELYDEETGAGLQCRALNITEDLGQLQYVFSDKTGTLTENKMVFRRCTVAGVEYSHDANGEPAAGG